MQQSCKCEPAHYVCFLTWAPYAYLSSIFPPSVCPPMSHTCRVTFWFPAVTKTNRNNGGRNKTTIKTQLKQKKSYKLDTYVSHKNFPPSFSLNAFLCWTFRKINIKKRAKKRHGYNLWVSAPEVFVFVFTESLKSSGNNGSVCN